MMAKRLQSSRSVGAVTLIALVLALLVGCQAPREPVPRDDVIGTWASIEPEFQTTLTLNGDDTFSVVSLPNETLSPSRSGTFDLVGTWSFGEPYAGTQRIELVGESPSGGKYTLPLLVHTVDSEIEVFFILGDPDSRDWLPLRQEVGLE